MKTQIVTITPEFAKKLLKKNTFNRPLDLKMVNEFKAYLNNNQWKLTHQGIAFSITDKLLDGQNRLTAISQGTKSVEMLLSTGLPDDTMMVIDVGKKRTPSDTFSLLQVSDHNTMAAVIAKYLRYSVGSFAGSSSRDLGFILSIQERYQFFLKNEQTILELLSLARKCYKIVKFYSISEIVAFSLTLILDKKYNMSQVSKFWLEVHMDKKFPQSTATNALSRILVKSLSGSEKIRPRNKWAITIKAWNNFIKNTSVRIAKFDERESFPKIL